MNYNTYRQCAIEISKSKSNEGYKAQALHCYYDENGRILYAKVRMYNESSKKKYIRPFHILDGKVILKEPEFDSLKPLYNLHEINKDKSKTVWIVEGEWCADSLSKFGLLSTTSGSSNSVDKCDWSPLKNRNIIIWSDNDDAGNAYGGSVISKLESLECNIECIDVGKLNLPSKGDCVDYIYINKIEKAEALTRLKRYIVKENWEDYISFENKSSIARDFPIEALPLKVKNAIVEYQKFGQQPISLIANSALAAMSLASQGLAKVAPNDVLISPISCYYLAVADSGERKSAADSTFKSGIVNWEKSENVKLKDAIKEYHSDYSIWSAEIEGIKAKLKRYVGSSKDKIKLEQSKEEFKNCLENEPIKIIALKLFHESITLQALLQKIANGYPSTALWSDEGGIILGSHAMKSEHQSAYFGFLNSIWSGNTCTNETKHAGDDKIEGQVLTCNLMVQKALFNDLVNQNSGKSRNIGYLARFLITMPKSTMGERFFNDSCKTDYLNEFNRRISEIISLPLPINENGILDPKVLHLDEKAKKVWKNYHDKIESKLKDGEDFATIRDFGSKSADIAARLAAQIHITEQGLEGDINEQKMKNACILAEWYLYEALRILNLASLKKVEKDALLLANWFISKNLKKINKSDLLQTAPNSIRKAKLINPALIELEERYYIKRNYEGRKEVITFNPNALENKEPANSAKTAKDKIALARLATLAA